MLSACWEAVIYPVWGRSITIVTMAAPSPPLATVVGIAARSGGQDCKQLQQGVVGSRAAVALGWGNPNNVPSARRGIAAMAKMEVLVCQQGGGCGSYGGGHFHALAAAEASSGQLDKSRWNEEDVAAKRQWQCGCAGSRQHKKQARDDRWQHTKAWKTHATRAGSRQCKENGRRMTITHAMRAGIGWCNKSGQSKEEFAMKTAVAMSFRGGSGQCKSGQRTMIDRQLITTARGTQAVPQPLENWWRQWRQQQWQWQLAAVLVDGNNPGVRKLGREGEWKGVERCGVPRTNIA